VFLVAAIAKLADMVGSRRALEGFGVPRTFVSPGAIALPLLELATVALLAVAPLAQAGAALATALLLAFVGGIAAALRRGAAPDCHCFGQLHSKPVGRDTLARNAALAAVAGFIIAAGPGPGIPTWFSHSSGVVVALVLMSLLATSFLYAGFSLWQHNRELTGRGRASQRPVAVEVGQAIPNARLVSSDGTKVTVPELLDEEQRSILVFTNATCAPCVELLPELARWRETLRGQLSIHVLAAGDAQENRRLASEHDLPVLLDPDGSAADSFGVPGTPGAIEIDPAGRVAAAPALGAPAIEGLIRAALSRPAQTPGLEVRHVSGSIVAPPARAPT
jgi:peroxiredoxin